MQHVVCEECANLVDALVGVDEVDAELEERGGLGVAIGRHAAGHRAAHRRRAGHVRLRHVVVLLELWVNEVVLVLVVLVVVLLLAQAAERRRSRSRRRR